MINKVQSTCKNINIGVSQGAVLSPVLFLLYINDIANSIKDRDIITMLFDDDTNIFIEGKHTSDLMHRAETSMVKLADWLSDNRLSLGIEKTEYRIFHSARSKIPDNCDQLNFRHFTINRVTSSKYLGMIIDDKLNWDSHINYLVGQLVKYTCIFKLISKRIPHSCQRKLYFANIYSRAQYRIEVYRQACTGQLKKGTSNAELHH